MTHLFLFLKCWIIDTVSLRRFHRVLRVKRPLYRTVKGNMILLAFIDSLYPPPIIPVYCYLIRQHSVYINRFFFSMALYSIGKYTVQYTVLGMGNVIILILSYY